MAAGDPGGALADNLTFRLAEALADRAELEPIDSPGRKSREVEALGLLDQPGKEPGLHGYWHLLKADLLRRGGKTGRGRERNRGRDQLEAASARARDRRLSRVPLFLEQKKLGEAIKCVESSKAERPVQGLWMVRLRLAQLAAGPPASEVDAVETDLFRWVKELRGQSSPESRQAMLDLATSGVQPTLKQPPEAWEALAEAYGQAGESAKAGDNLVRAADRAAALGQASTAAGYRLRGGAFLFQAGKFREAEGVLAAVVDDPAAGPLRAKAGMLRALALGRALALRLPGASSNGYTAALDRQIREFPADPSTDEGAGSCAAALPWLQATVSVPSRCGRPSCPAPTAGSTPGSPSLISIATSWRPSCSTLSVIGCSERFLASDRFLESCVQPGAIGI